MAFTGDLEHLPLVDIIQLLSSSKKSGILYVKGSKGESRIVFSNGSIVGANHLNSKIRIGRVLVKINAVTQEDLDQAIEVQTNSGKDRKPLIATLIEMGKIGVEEAFKGLRKLIEMTVVELVSWEQGTFILDTDDISVSDECRYLPAKMDQEVSLDAQMVLMDALRIIDERERDRQAGKVVQSDEEIFAEDIPSKVAVEYKEKSLVITADDLGLADIDKLEKKIPQSFSDIEIIDPAKVHRQKIGDILAEFSAEDQESFIAFLTNSAESLNINEGAARQEGKARAVILFSRDRLIKHSVMTVCNNEGFLVFAVEEEEELVNILDLCLTKQILPIMVFDTPETSDEGLSKEKIIGLRQQVKEKYPQAANIQLASPPDYTFTLQSFNDGVRAVLPKPLKEAGEETFIEDTIKFLETFKSYINGFLNEQRDLSTTDNLMGKLRNFILVLRDLAEPSDLSSALLQFISEIFERTITFLVRPTELTGEKAIGVNNGKNMGPTSAAKLKIPLTKPSGFSDVIEKGQVFYGKVDDEVLKKHLFDEIGAPLSSSVLLLPLKSLGKTVILAYGDFGRNAASPVKIDLLEILANQAGLALENALYRKHFKKDSQK
jgi:hypothetical protein